MSNKINLNSIFRFKGAESYSDNNNFSQPQS